MQYKIEKGRPMPHRRGNVIVDNYPFPHMRKGDSVFFPIGTAPGEFNAGTVSKYITKANVLLKPKRFVRRTMDGGLRVWRIE